MVLIVSVKIKKDKKTLGYVTLLYQNELSLT